MPPQLPGAVAGAKRGGGGGLLIGAAVVGVLVVGGGLFAAWQFVVKPRIGGTVAQLTPPPATPSAMARPTEPPTPIPATPPEAIPTAEATPEDQATRPPAPSPTPSGKATPTPSPSGKATPTPSPSAKPTPTPSPSPSPRKATPTPAPTSAATSATGSSAEQQRAAQVASLLGQADSAIGNHQYDQAVGLLDDALRLDPGNSRATTQRARTVQLRDTARKRFVAGRTTVTTEKAPGGGLSGFEGAAVQKAPDFLGRIEFEMAPASGLQAGDAWSLRLYVVNEGKKAIRITALQVSTVVDGERSGGSTPPKGRDIEPQQRVLIGEVPGTWKDGTTSWAAEVAVVARGDSLKNTLTWR